MGKPTSFLQALLDHIEEHASEIYVRDRIDGKLGTYALTELPASRAIHWTVDFIRRRHFPNVPVKEKP